MKRSTLIIIYIIIIAIIIGIIITRQELLEKGPDSPTPIGVAPQSFTDCVEAGYLIQESFPRRCTTPQGQTFTEDISTPSAPQPYADLIQVTAPLANSAIQSPVTITGQARGNWYFEASFPVTLQDDRGNVLAQEPAQAQGEWMTEDFVPFSITLTFSKPSTKTGRLILHNDNASGLPEHDKQIEIPVIFE